MDTELWCFWGNVWHSDQSTFSALGLSPFHLLLPQNLLSPYLLLSSPPFSLLLSCVFFSYTPVPLPSFWSLVMKGTQGITSCVCVCQIPTGPFSTNLFHNDIFDWWCYRWMHAKWPNREFLPTINLCCWKEQCTRYSSKGKLEEVTPITSCPHCLYTTLFYLHTCMYTCRQVSKHTCIQTWITLRDVCESKASVKQQNIFS